MRLSRVVAWTGLTVAVLAAIGSIVANLSATTGRLSWGELVLTAVLALLIAGVGLFLVVRADAGRVSGLLLSLGVILALDLVVRTTGAVVLLDHGSGSRLWRLLVAMSSADWVVVFATLAALAFLFPDGRTLAGRWRLLFHASLAVYAMTFVAVVLSRSTNSAPFDHVSGAFPGIAWLFVPLVAIGWPLSLVALVLAAVAVVVRYRRSQGIERLQLKWLAWSVSTVPLTLAACTLLSLLLGSYKEVVVNTLYLLSLTLLPLSVAVAVTRYRLYAIDRIVNRTLVYAALTALLGAIWGIVVMLGGVVLGAGSPWATAAATLAVALVFNQARRRLQRLVDNRFDRERVSGVTRVRSFEEAVRAGEAEPEDIGDVLRAALRDPTAELLFRLPASEVYANERAETVADLAVAGHVRSPIVRRGQEVGVLLQAAGVVERRDLLEGVLAASSLTVEIARLRIELRMQLTEVERSRARLVRASYDERRRLERDLHDGAQQRLVSLGIVLRRIQRSLPMEARVLGPALDGAVAEVGLAISDLRTIAAGVRPARLEEGLGAAIAEMARAAPIPVAVDVAVEKLPALVEEAAYFVACEAVTNAVKHGSPSRVEVRASRENGSLHLTVVDDGIGGARMGGGSGLVGLADRVHAHGGSLTIDSPEGAGTRVEVEIPCAS
jgi:signal transduction histidine kinase